MSTCKATSVDNLLASLLFIIISTFPSHRFIDKQLSNGTVVEASYMMKITITEKY